MARRRHRGDEYSRELFSVQLIDHIVILLMSFDFVKYPDDFPQTIESVEADLKEIPVVQRALTRRARRAFRIEEKLDRILARLDGGKATVAGKSITVILNDGTPATHSAEGNYTHG